MERVTPKTTFTISILSRQLWTRASNSLLAVERRKPVVIARCAAARASRTIDSTGDMEGDLSFDWLTLGILFSLSCGIHVAVDTKNAAFAERHCPKLLPKPGI